MESLGDWAGRLHELAYREGWGNLSNPRIQSQMVLQFCQGCANRQAGLVVLTSHPITLDEAIQHLRWADYSRKVVYGRDKSQYPKGSRRHL